eukprot:gene4792-6719_t
MSSLPNISTHVLDTSTGSPANKLNIYLYFGSEVVNDGLGGLGELDTAIQWDLYPVMSTETDTNGRAKFEFETVIGVYKMVFMTQHYFQQTGTPCFYPKVEIIFRISDPNSHHHVPLILSPFGYSTYRGS